MEKNTAGYHITVSFFLSCLVLSFLFFLSFFLFFFAFSVGVLVWRPQEPITPQKCLFIYLEKEINTSHTHIHTHTHINEILNWRFCLLLHAWKKANSREISQFAECFPRSSACFQSLALSESESAWFLVMWGLKTAGPRLQCTTRVWKYQSSFLDSNVVHLVFFSFFFWSFYWIKQ